MKNSTLTLSLFSCGLFLRVAALLSRTLKRSCALDNSPICVTAMQEVRKRDREARREKQRSPSSAQSESKRETVPPALPRKHQLLLYWQLFFFSLTFSEWGRLKSKTDFCTNQHMGAYHVDMHVVTCAIPATISRLHRCASAMSTSAQCRCHFSTFLF